MTFFVDNNFENQDVCFVTCKLKKEPHYTDILAFISRTITDSILYI